MAASAFNTEYTPPANFDSDPKFGLTLHDYQLNYESVTVDSGQLVAFAKNFGMESAYGLRDGSILFLRNTVEDPATFHLWRLQTDPNTGKFLNPPQQLTQQDYELKQISASPNGQELVAVRGVNGHPNIYVADLSPPRQQPRFTRIHRLTFSDADEYLHAWSPDS